MFEPTGNKVVLTSNNGHQVCAVYTYEDEYYAKQGAYFKLLRENNQVQYGGKIRWHKFYDIGGKQIQLFKSESKDG